MAEHMKPPPREWAGICARMPCAKEGIFRIKRGNAWSHFCKECYMIVNDVDIKAEWVAAGKPTDKQSYDRIKEILASPKPTPLQHWQKTLTDMSLPQASRDMAKVAIARLTRSEVKERVPGEDDV